MKTKRFVVFLLTVASVFLILSGSVSAISEPLNEPETDVSDTASTDLSSDRSIDATKEPEETTTEVCIRLCFAENEYEYAECSFTVVCLGEDGEEQWRVNPLIYRASHWETTLFLAYGKYRIIGCCPVNVWNNFPSGKTEDFDVYGNKMVVYVPMCIGDKIPEIPEAPIVYGESTIAWINKTDITEEDDTEKQEDSQENTTSVTVPDIQNNDSEQTPEKSSKRLSAVIGTVIFTVILVAVIVGCLIIIRKRK